MPRAPGTVFRSLLRGKTPFQPSGEEVAWLDQASRDVRNKRVQSIQIRNLITLVSPEGAPERFYPVSTKMRAKL